VKPIVNGLVHNEAVGDLIMAMTPARTGSDTFKTLMFGILKKVTDMDLTTYKRAGANRMRWDEWKQLQKNRNELIHEGIVPSAETLGLCVPVALEFLKVVFPSVLASLGLTVNGYLMIAKDPQSLV
jgi:hypothetical protein